MFLTFLRNELKYARRHPAADGNMTTNIIFGVLMAIILLNILTFGLIIEDVLMEFAPGKDPVKVFNSTLLYYFFADLILRLFFQSVPGMGIRPYLLLPINKKKIIHFLLSQSLWSLFPVIPLMIIMPYYFQVLIHQVSLMSSLIWLFGLILLFYFMTFAVLYLKRRMGTSPGMVAIVAGIFIGLIFLTNQGLISLPELSTHLFGKLLDNPAFVLIPIAMLSAIYYLNFRYLYQHSYPEEIQHHTDSKAAYRQYSFLQRYGELGALTALELKLIFRNKRSKSTIFMIFGLFLLAWPFYKYYIPNYLPQTKFADYRQDNIPVPQADEQLVTFIVSADTPPPLEQVCIAGEQAYFGAWQPDLVPLELGEDSVWTRSFTIPKGDSIKFKITGASWDNEALYADGEIPDAFETVIRQDTTINIHVNSWNTGEMSSILSLFVMYASIYFSGLILMGYGQLLLGWEGSYFDFILVQKIDYAKYFQVKYLVMVLGTLVVFILFIPNLFFGAMIRNIILASFIYNLGINAHLLLFQSTKIKTRINLSDGVFSMQGKSGMQVLNVLLMLFIPMFIYGFLTVRFSPDIGLFAIWITGILGLLMHPIIIKKTVGQFNKRKYILGAALREK